MYGSTMWFIMTLLQSGRLTGLTQITIEYVTDSDIFEVATRCFWYSQNVQKVLRTHTHVNDFKWVDNRNHLILWIAEDNE